MERAKPDASASQILRYQTLAAFRRNLEHPLPGTSATQHHLKAVQQPPLARMLNHFSHE